MSRHGLDLRGFDDYSICGWDAALATYYAQVWPNDGDPNEPPPFWVGDQPGAIQTVEELAAALAPFGRLDDRLMSALRADAAHEHAPDERAQVIVVDDGSGRPGLVDVVEMHRLERERRGPNPALQRPGPLSRFGPGALLHRRRVQRVLADAAAELSDDIEGIDVGPMPAGSPFPERAAEAAWLDVPFDDNDTIKRLGARWDSQRRAWYAPAGTPLVPLLPWLADPPLDAEPHLTIHLLGLTVACWKCGQPTCCVVGLMDADTLEVEDLIRADDPLVLRVAGQLLDERRRAEYRVGPIRKRHSKTVGAAYVSNGCVACDALQGEFYLFHEELPEALADPAGVVGLDSLGLHAIPTVVYDAMVRRAFE